jgi:hypothetical protein
MGRSAIRIDDRDNHLETHPEALILDEDDEFVFVGFKVPKQWLTQNFRFLQALASVRNMTVRRGL